MAIYENGTITDTSGHNGQSAFVDPLTVDIYRFMDHAFKGQSGFRDGTYLVPHPRENRYTVRRQRNYYRNFFRPVVQAMVSPVFIEKPGRTLNDAEVPEDGYAGRFLVDCDNRGHSLEAVIEKAVQSTRLHGVSFLIMDNFSREKLPRTMRQAQQERVFPYVYTKKRYDVRDYVVDGFGRISSVIFADTPVTVTGTDGKPKKEKRFRGWDSRDCVIYREDRDGKLEELERFTHGLGRVPVLVLQSADDIDETDPFNTDPPLYDLARMNWAIYQNDSWIEAIKADQGCSILYAPGNKPPSGMNIGTTIVWYVGQDPAFPPGFIAPPAELLESMRAEVDALREDFYRIAEQNGVSALSPDASGESKRWEFQAHGWVLARTAGMAKLTEEWCMRMLGLYVSEDYTGYVATYKSDFEPRNTAEEIGNIDRGLMIGLGSEGDKELRKRAATVLLKKYVTPDRLREITDTIDSEEFDKQQTNFDDMSNG